MKVLIFGSTGMVGQVMPLLRSFFPNFITSTEKVGRAMIAVAKNGADQKILRAPDFNRF